MGYIQRVFDVMRRAHWHRFQVLTKLADGLAELSPELAWRENVWMGVSVEDAEHVDRIDELRPTGAHVKFLSLEPLLGPLPKLRLENIDWVIVGGESGPRARPMDPAWVTDIRDQCQRAGVAFFFKQWGGKNKKAPRRGKPQRGQGPTRGEHVPRNARVARVRGGMVPHVVRNARVARSRAGMVGASRAKCACGAHSRRDGASCGSKCACGAQQSGHGPMSDERSGLTGMSSSRTRACRPRTWCTATRRSGQPRARVGEKARAVDRRSLALTLAAASCSIRGSLHPTDSARCADEDSPERRSDAPRAEGAHPARSGHRKVASA